jgi:hypothetical protein
VPKPAILPNEADRSVGVDARLSPFSGKYRKAAVIHDHYCESRIRPWQTVHNMFHKAMLAAGVDKVKADAMFAAVYAFGPRWKFRKGHWTSRNVVRRRRRRSSYQSHPYGKPKQRRWIPTRATLLEVAKIPEAEQQAAAKELARWIEENQPTKSQIIARIQKAQVREKGAKNLKK